MVISSAGAYYVSGKIDPGTTRRKRVTLTLVGIRRDNEYLLVAEDN